MACIIQPVWQQNHRLKLPKSSRISLADRTLGLIDCKLDILAVPVSQIQIIWTGRWQMICVTPSLEGSDLVRHLRGDLRPVAAYDVVDFRPSRVSQSEWLAIVGRHFKKIRDRSGIVACITMESETRYLGIADDIAGSIKDVRLHSSIEEICIRAGSGGAIARLIEDDYPQRNGQAMRIGYVIEQSCRVSPANATIVTDNG